MFDTPYAWQGGLRLGLGPGLDLGHQKWGHIMGLVGILGSQKDCSGATFGHSFHRVEKKNKQRNAVFLDQTYIFLKDRLDVI